MGIPVARDSAPMESLPVDRARFFCGAVFIEFAHGLIETLFAVTVHGEASPCVRDPDTSYLPDDSHVIRKLAKIQVFERFLNGSVCDGDGVSGVIARRPSE
jgi:hypothetical protein